jgi:hypothetical protein
MIKKIQIIFIVAFITVLSACGGGGGGGSAGSVSSQSASDSMSLSGADALMVAPTGLATSQLTKLKTILQDTVYAVLGIKKVIAQSTSTTNQVYAIDPNGNITPSNVADLISGVSNNPATVNFALDSPKYIIFGYNNLYQPRAGGTRKQCVLVGVRKTDGKFACISASPRCDSSNTCNVSAYGSQIKTDPSGNMLFVVLGDGGLEKVDLTDPANPIETSIFTHNNLGDASFPIVNANGDVFTSINLGSTQTLTRRVYMASGGFYEIPDSSNLNDISCAFVGGANNSSNFFFIQPKSADDKVYYNKLTRNNDGTFTSTTLFNQPLTGNNASVLAAGCSTVVSNGNRMFGINWFNPQNPTAPSNSLLIEYPSSGSNVTKYNLDASFPVTKDLQSHDDGLVIMGTNLSGTTSGIQRFDLATNTLTTVLQAGSYLINAMTVSSNGDIKFTGTRVSDGANVIATLPKTTATIAQSALSVKPISIVTTSNLVSPD